MCVYKLNDDNNNNNVPVRRLYAILPDCERSEHNRGGGHLVGPRETAKLVKIYNTKVVVVEENILQNYFDFSPNNTV